MGAALGKGLEPWPRRSHEEDLLKSINKFAAGVVANEFIWTWAAVHAVDLGSYGGP